MRGKWACGAAKARVAVIGGVRFGDSDWEAQAGAGSIADAGQGFFGHLPHAHNGRVGFADPANEGR